MKSLDLLFAHCADDRKEIDHALTKYTNINVHFADGVDWFELGEIPNPDVAILNRNSAREHLNFLGMQGRELNFCRRGEVGIHAPFLQTNWRYQQYKFSAFTKEETFQSGNTMQATCEFGQEQWRAAIAYAILLAHFDRKDEQFRSTIHQILPIERAGPDEYLCQMVKRITVKETDYRMLLHESDRHRQTWASSALHQLLQEGDLRVSFEQVMERYSELQAVTSYTGNFEKYAQLVKQQREACQEMIRTLADTLAEYRRDDL